MNSQQRTKNMIMMKANPADLADDTFVGILEGNMSIYGCLSI